MLNKLKIMKGITFIIHVEDLTKELPWGLPYRPLSNEAS
jgi:hypothetical protein